jgi:WD40-like Beta Propeller Repeat
MIRKLAAVAATATLTVLPISTEAAQGVRMVMVRGAAICTQHDTGPVSCFASNSAPKSLPVWSKDGTRIAYIEDADKRVMLAYLIVIDQHGQLILKLPVKPYSVGEVQSGMRDVEAIEWLTRDRIAVSGSVNPSTTEYIIYDLSAAKPVREFFDDGSGAAFSADGQHYASVSGRPHFTPVDQRATTLNVDDTPVFESGKNSVSFSEKPQWSPDSKSVAILMTDAARGVHAVLRWSSTSKVASSIALPFSSGEPEALAWRNGNLYVQRKVVDQRKSAPDTRRADSEAWLTTASVPVRWTRVAASSASDPVGKAIAFRAQLDKTTRSVGGKDHDFWCEACSLTVLSRRSGARD